MTKDEILAAYAETEANFRKLRDNVDVVVAAAETMTQLIKAGGKAIFCGNGGSAADAQHLAAELMGRFMIDRAPLAAMALSVNTSTITAVGNDYSYDEIFDRQLRGIGRAGDVLIGLSTSGNSRNVVRAVKAGKEMGIFTIALTGEGGGKMAEIADLAIKVPSRSTPRIQEMHIAVGHSLCEWVEAALA